MDGERLPPPEFAARLDRNDDPAPGQGVLALGAEGNPVAPAHAVGVEPLAGEVLPGRVALGEFVEADEPFG